MKSIINDNIEAVIGLSDLVATTLGPVGMNKLLVDNIGDMTVTNDGGVIIDKIELNHPVVKLVAETAKGLSVDGRKTVIVLTGELLRQAGKLLEQGLKPAQIINGYDLALKDSLKILRAQSIKGELKNAINTSINNDLITSLIVESVSKALPDDVRVIKKTGGNVSDSRLINGLMIDKERVHSGMPSKVKQARILITKTPLEPRTTEFNAGVEINSPSELSHLINNENESINRVIKAIINSGANVIFCQKGISDYAQELLARNNILAIRRVREDDIKLLIKATGASLVSNIIEVKESDLGNAGLISTEQFSDERLTVINDCAGRVVTIMVRGSTKQVVDETEQLIKKGLGIARLLTKSVNCVPGAGAIELIISNELSKSNINGRESISYQSFALSVKRIIELLAINSGVKAIDLMTHLKNGEGINAEGGIINPLKEGIIEPLIIKEQVFTSATETANMILRIDGILKGK
ncbi:MAG: TCP-1/cpn60 chaperonin family protein [Candidatus Nanoarchaeia archaeon]|jgi:chaperonin GroEL (HSP60 family)